MICILQKTCGTDYVRIIAGGHPEHVEGSGWRAFFTLLLRQAQDDLWVGLAQEDLWVRFAQEDLWVRFANGRNSILQYVL